MIERAKRLAETFRKYGVEYLFIGKFGAILYGYPGTTQDMDIFPSKDRQNGKKLASALRELTSCWESHLFQVGQKGPDARPPKF